MSRQWMCELERCSGGSGGPQLLHDHGDDLEPSDPAETGPSQVLHAAHVSHEMETFLFFSSLSCLMSDPRWPICSFSSSCSCVLAAL